MIRSVTIRGLRGVRSGELEELTPLVVLVGPNGCGKSTVLDALLVGASNTPGDALVQAARRRPDVLDGLERLVPRRSGQHDARDGRDDGDPPDWRLRVTSDGLDRARTTAIQVVSASQGQPASARMTVAPSTWVTVSFSAAGYSVDRPLLVAAVTTDARLVEVRGGPTEPPLHRLYGAALQRGRQREVEESLRALVPRLVGLQILTGAGDQPELHVALEDGTDGTLRVAPSVALPVALFGDGVQALARQCLELAAQDDGLVLLEEPEAFKHPAAIHQTARAIVAATSRGVQVVLTTHSLELIDALVSASHGDALANLSLYRVALESGVLRTSRLGGHDVKLLRSQIEEDLR